MRCRQCHAGAQGCHSGSGAGQGCARAEPGAGAGGTRCASTALLWLPSPMLALALLLPLLLLLPCCCCHHRCPGPAASCRSVGCRSLPLAALSATPVAVDRRSCLPCFCRRRAGIVRIQITDSNNSRYRVPSSFFSPKSFLGGEGREQQHAWLAAGNRQLPWAG